MNENNGETMTNDANDETTNVEPAAPRRCESLGDARQDIDNLVYGKEGDWKLDTATRVLDYIEALRAEVERQKNQIAGLQGKWNYAGERFNFQRTAPTMTPLEQRNPTWIS